MSVELEDKEWNGSVDNSNHEENNINKNNYVTETVVVQEEDVQLFWDDQSV